MWSVWPGCGSWHSLSPFRSVGDKGNKRSTQERELTVCLLEVPGLRFFPFKLPASSVPFTPHTHKHIIFSLKTPPRTKKLQEGEKHTHTHTHTHSRRAVGSASPDITTMFSQSARRRANHSASFFIPTSSLPHPVVLSG